LGAGANKNNSLMKKRILLYTMLAMFFATNAAATVWRVNNNAGVSADFNNLQTAINSASVLAFDTLYVEGSYTTYGAISLSKPLILIGTGYFLSENDTTQAFMYNSTISSANINSGSEGSKIIGFLIDGRDIVGFCSIYIKSSHITILRNRMIYNGGTDFAIKLAGNDLHDIVVEGNFISLINGGGAGIGTFSNGANGLNIIIRNNYIKAYNYSINLPINSYNGIFVSNNILTKALQTNSAIFTNNIMIEGTISGSGNAYYNNIGNSTQFGSQNGNQQNVNMSNVFVNHTSGVDNGLLLKPGSPAIGAGFGGVDCGIFGGENPYVLSGLPPIPSIFEVNQAGIGSPNTPIQVNLKAKSNR
jgi:hypothetical protein